MPLGEDEELIVREQSISWEVPRAPGLQPGFTPLHYIQMDITNNCNLRCPFCVSDYTGVNRIRLMSEATFRNSLALIPYVGEANFWLSCAHEPTMHADLLKFIGIIPMQYRSKVILTTNLARRLEPEFFECLASSGLHHVNISIESFERDVYERMRDGARHDIFMINLERRRFNDKVYE